MLLKNKAPSLKPSNISSTITTSLCNPSSNNVQSIDIKEEVYETQVLIYKKPKEELTEDISKVNVDDNTNAYSSKLKSGVNVINLNLIESPIGTSDKIMEQCNNGSDSHIILNNEKKLKKDQNPPVTKKVIQRKRKSNSNIDNKIYNNINPPKSLDSGVYVECDSCQKTRYLPDILNPSDIPSIWTCEMANNKSLNCSVPEESFENSVDYFINNKYTLGSVVWAKAPGFCWWPALIDDDPDLNMFYWCFDRSDDVSHYHVTFLDDDVSRSWIKNKDIKVFHGKADMSSMKFAKSKKDYSKLLNKAVERAEECLTLSLQKCLDKYSFAVRYTGKPNVWTSKNQLAMKRNYKSQSKNVDSDDGESSSDAKLTSSSNSNKKNEIKIKNENEVEDLNIDVANIEAKTENLMKLNQSTKYDLIIKNSTKENKKSKKKLKKSEIIEE